MSDTYTRYTTKRLDDYTAHDSGGERLQRLLLLRTMEHISNPINRAVLNAGSGKWEWYYFKKTVEGVWTIHFTNTLHSTLPKKTKNWTRTMFFKADELYRDMKWGMEELNMIYADTYYYIDCTTQDNLFMDREYKAIFDNYESGGIKRSYKVPKALHKVFTYMLEDEEVYTGSMGVLKDCELVKRVKGSER